MALSVFVWAMIGIALWHFTVFVPERFWGGIIGAFLAALAGSLVSGLLLPSPGIPSGNPPGLVEALWPLRGGMLALVASYSFEHVRPVTTHRRALVRDYLDRASRDEATPQDPLAPPE